jgi:hypothetical protein
MDFDSSQYGPDVLEVLALSGDGRRPFPLVLDQSPSPEIVSRLESLSARQLFSRASAPEAAMAGLWLYFGAFDRSHSIAQDIPTPEGSYWHGILHRHEPDAGNAGYWFRRVGQHPIFPALRDAAEFIVESCEADFTPGERWDPFAFIEFYERARRSSAQSAAGDAVRAIALAEWQLLFDYCARPIH